MESCIDKLYGTQIATLDSMRNFDETMKKDEAEELLRLEQEVNDEIIIEKKEARAQEREEEGLVRM